VRDGCCFRLNQELLGGHWRQGVFVFPVERVFSMADAMSQELWFGRTHKNALWPNFTGFGALSVYFLPKYVRRFGC
jgi:hypothetical protein